MDKSESVDNYYTVQQIREAFAKHAREDDWGVPKFSEVSLIAALRGEYEGDER